MLCTSRRCDENVDIEKEIILKEKSVLDVLRLIREEFGTVSVRFLSQESKLSSLSRILKRKNGTTLFERFYNEFNRLYGEGKINNGFIESDEGNECLCLLIDSFEKYPLKEDKFKILKRIFFIACESESMDALAVLPSEYMKITASLEAGELLVLIGCQKMKSSDQFSKVENNHHLWSLKIAEFSGLKTKELVDFHAERLVTKKILFGFTKAGGFEGSSEWGRLTPLGIDLCKFIEN